VASYYNEYEPFAAQWLRNLKRAKLIADGDVDERSIEEVAPDDLVWYDQCHFFAGLGGWPLACRMAGWPDDREIWTGSPPCQPFSVAGNQLGIHDGRHLWPHYFRLVRARRPAVLVGEQVANAIGKGWLDGVFADLDSEDYARRAVVLPACAVNGPHRRDRIMFIGDRDGAVDHRERTRLQGHAGHGDGAEGRSQSNRSTAAASRGGAVGDANTQRVGERGQRERADQGSDALASAGAMDSRDADRDGAGAIGSAWAGARWIIGHDGRARRIEPSIRLLADGVPARVGRLRAYGNAIVPELGAEVLKAYLDCMP
jgi:DNA (cytosine-5)-methyltransferase 1